MTGNGHKYERNNQEYETRKAKEKRLDGEKENAKLERVRRNAEIKGKKRKENKSTGQGKRRMEENTRDHKRKLESKIRRGNGGNSDR